MSTAPEAPAGVTVIGGAGAATADTRERAGADGHYMLNGLRHVVRAGDRVPFGAELVGAAKAAEPAEDKSRPAPAEDKAKPKPKPAAK